MTKPENIPAFPITTLEITEPHLSWGGRYKDFGWEICKWGKSYDGLPYWNSYVYINKKEHVEMLWTDEKKVYNWGIVYIPKSILEGLSWNCGQTYYHQFEDNGKRYIKIGDDYQHYWDEQYRSGYSEKWIAGNLIKIMDELDILLQERSKTND